jgi:hypothetical protein
MDATSEQRLAGGLTWEQMADGRLWRLKAGKHYPRGGGDAICREAETAAKRMDKRVKTLRDEFGKFQFVWVQFAQHGIPVGAACPECGGARILRDHEKFGRCAACGATLFLTGAAERSASRPDHDLTRYTDVNLRPFRELPGREQYAGYGVRPNGRPALLIVDYYVDSEGDRIPDPARPGQPLYRVRFFPAEAFVEALGPDAFPDLEP